MIECILNQCLIHQTNETILVFLRTALHFAVQNGHEAVVVLLLENGCDVNAKDMVSGLNNRPKKWFY